MSTPQQTQIFLAHEMERLAELLRTTGATREALLSELLRVRAELEAFTRRLDIIELRLRTVEAAFSTAAVRGIDERD